ncbi:pyridine nucleotide-disulfide oxidoreductase domain-containing protein 2-like [Corticium candelabrum]|uniref:pyridine nucleotide-disulfide oxidoreductase domain-containing protein 2-like n=1 Tax=Corticium candelabrum TaxID=121492 RepID=UPI002E270299|nr:pyridine nucleotide-disulfide oxidoreductase domain-containing protein 2-like [Corticium candelabrum]
MRRIRSIRTACSRCATVRLQATRAQSARDFVDTKIRGEYDAIVVGAGHNGLIASAYLQMAGKRVLILEKREIVGGACVTEEIIPGFAFSRASYLLSLLRPQIAKELKLKDFGLQLYLRDTVSFTPLVDSKVGQKPAFLLLSRDMAETQRQIAKFSIKDSKAYEAYQLQMCKYAAAIEPILDYPPPHPVRLSENGWRSAMRQLQPFKQLLKSVKALGSDWASFFKLATGPASSMLNSWFESEPLKSTLATDAIIGAMLSPNTPGSGYVLLHHVMGEVEGVRDAWAYPRGGMGAVTTAIARSASALGVTIKANAPVGSVLVDESQSACGVILEDGTQVKTRLVLSNATPSVTFLRLIPPDALAAEFVDEVTAFDYTSPVTKINVAVDSLPNFKASPNRDSHPELHHRATIHLGCESINALHRAYLDAQNGRASARPVIEMCIPSSLDPTVAPSGKHVVSLFVQYTPYDLADGTWNNETKNDFANRVFSVIEEYAPGFTSSILGFDILTPPDLENVFGLTGGNIFHGAMGLHQLYFARPTPAYCNYRSPIRGLYLCGSGTHPGGGVMGASGRNAALTALQDLQVNR